MILAIVNSINGVPIRLTEERWEHVVDQRPHMASYIELVLAAVEQPTVVLRGQRAQTLPARYLPGVQKAAGRVYIHSRP